MAVTACWVENSTCYTWISFPTIIFEKSVMVQLVGCVWPKGRTQYRMLDFSTCNSSPCYTKVEEDDQQNETTMVPATFTKHLFTIATNPTKRKRLEEQPGATQGKEGERAHNISRRWKVYNCNFQLFLFEIALLKNWPCRSANLILEFRSVFMRVRPNPCPSMCIHFSLHLLYEFVLIS